MKSAILKILLVVAGIALLLVAASCTTERYAPAIDHRVDSTLVAAGLPPLSVRRVKFNGPVTFQVGGSNNTATQLGKAKAPLATAAHATVTAPVTKAGVPWQVYAGGALLLLLLGFYVRGRLRLPFPF
jgi:hypothetical protein